MLIEVNRSIGHVNILHGDPHLYQIKQLNMKLGTSDWTCCTDNTLVVQKN